MSILTVLFIGYWLYIVLDTSASVRSDRAMIRSMSPIEAPAPPQSATWRHRLVVVRILAAAALLLALVTAVYWR